MNKIISGLFAAALVGTVGAIADTGAAPTPTTKDLVKDIEQGPYVQVAEKGVKLSGYVDAGYSYNFNNGSGLVNRAGAAGAASNAGDRTARGDFNLNALKLALEKPLTDANELQAGFRTDILMGEDASFLGGNAGGANTASDSIYLQQAYVQFRAPVGNGLDFKVGKFVTPLGYEVQERPANMNISYGNLFQNAQPLQHLGVLASYKFNDLVDAKFGVVNGWNNDNNTGGINAIGGTSGNDSTSLLATVNLTAPGGNANLQNGLYYSFNGESNITNNASDEDDANILYDVWGSWAPKFAKDKLLLGFNIDLGKRQYSTATIGNSDSSTIWGAALYAKYKFTDIFSLAARADYFHTDDQNIVTYTGRALNNDVWSGTLTASFDIIENMMLRAEYRLDYADSEQGPGDNGPAHYAGAQVVYSF